MHPWTDRKKTSHLWAQGRQNTKASFHLEVTCGELELQMPGLLKKRRQSPESSQAGNTLRTRPWDSIWAHRWSADMPAPHPKGSTGKHQSLNWPEEGERSSRFSQQKPRRHGVTTHIHTLVVQIKCHPSLPGKEILDSITVRVLKKSNPDPLWSSYLHPRT